MSWQCPVHGSAWYCPEDCVPFANMIDEQIDEARSGNFVRLRVDADGVMWRQDFRNHQPVGEPREWRTRRRKGDQ